MAVSFLFPIASFEGKAPLGRTVKGDLNLVAKDVPETMSQILNGGPVTIGQKGFVNTWPLLVLVALVIAISIVSIFLYKKRVLQMRVVAVGFLLGVVEIFLIFIWSVDAFVDKATRAMACTEVDVDYGIGTWCAVLAVIMLFLAERSIRKDEEKVRAADRLR